MNKYRFRNIYMFVGTFLVIALWVATDPDFGLIKQLEFGASTVAMILFLSKTVVYTTILHMSRKALMDYPEADLQGLIKKALESSNGAGLAVIGFGLIMVAISILVFAAVSS